MKRTKPQTPLARLMQKRGLSQNDLARPVGITQQAVSAYIRGHAKPNMEHACAIAGVLGITVEHLCKEFAVK